MAKIHIKPLSVNEAYRGRRFSTPELKKYKEDLVKILPKLKVPVEKLAVRYKFGVSSKGSDGDNLIKAFQDCIASQYGFNDKIIYRWEVEKEDVQKGREYIEFEINEYKGQINKSNVV